MVEHVDKALLSYGLVSCGGSLLSLLNTNSMRPFKEPAGTLRAPELGSVHETCRGKAVARDVGCGGRNKTVHTQRNGIRFSASTNAASNR